MVALMPKPRLVLTGRRCHPSFADEHENSIGPVHFSPDLFFEILAGIDGANILEHVLLADHEAKPVIEPAGLGCGIVAPVADKDSLGHFSKSVICRSIRPLEHSEETGFYEVLLSGERASFYQHRLRRGSSAGKLIDEGGAAAVISKRLASQLGRQLNEALGQPLLGILRGRLLSRCPKRRLLQNENDIPVTPCFRKKQPPDKVGKARRIIV